MNKTFNDGTQIFNFVAWPQTDAQGNNVICQEITYMCKVEIEDGKFEFKTMYEYHAVNRKL